MPTFVTGDVWSYAVPVMAVIEEKNIPLDGGYVSCDSGGVWSKLNVDEAKV
jgi:hypothetical protein